MTALTNYHMFSVLTVQIISLFRVLEVRSLEALTLDWNLSVDKTSKEFLRDNPLFVSSSFWCLLWFFGLCVSAFCVSLPLWLDCLFFFCLWVKFLSLPLEKDLWLHLAFRVQPDDPEQTCHNRILYLVISAKTFPPSSLP